LNPPNCFSNPRNTLSNYVQGVIYILYKYNLHHNLGRAPTVEKFTPSYFFTIQTLATLEPSLQRAAMKIRISLALDQHSSRQQHKPTQSVNSVDCIA